nr:M23 family metallopeptidase [Streptomyces sp. SID4948]
MPPPRPPAPPPRRRSASRPPPRRPPPRRRPRPRPRPPPAPRPTGSPSWPPPTSSRSPPTPSPPATARPTCGATPHAGQDFDAPTGTPVHAVHGGTVTSAGWAGAYGYRVVVALDDGTELWYCHLSTMVVNSGPVTTGDTIGRVGATGNVPAPHLHLEVRPGGGDAVDPVGWLAARHVEV